MKKAIILIFAVVCMAVSQKTMAQQDITIPYHKGQKGMALKIDPVMFQLDQVFYLDQEYEKIKKMKDEDFNIFVMNEGFGFRFVYHGDEAYGKMMLKSVLQKSVIIKISKLPYVNVIFSSDGGFILYFSRQEDPFFFENPEIEYNILSWESLSKKI